MLKELGKLGAAALLGWILTIGTFWFANGSLDAQLRTALAPYFDAAGEAPSNPDRVRLERDVLHLTQALGAEDFKTSKGQPPKAEADDPSELRRILGQTLLYGSPEVTAWYDGTFAGWTAPFLEDSLTKATVEERARVLLRGCTDLAQALGIAVAEDSPCDGAVTPDLDRNWRQRAVPSLDAILADLQDDNETQLAFQIRRYLNGGIQAITLWMMWSAVLLLVLFWVPGVRAELAVLRRPEALAKGQAPPYASDASAGAFPSSEVIVRPDATCIQYRQWLQHLHTASNERGSLDVLIQTCNGFLKSRTVDAARQSAQTRFEQLQEEVDSRLEAVRYLAWAIPSFGFIGTVLGIGSAMFDADAIVSAGTDRVLQQSAIQLVTGQLGTAFDTTLVALVASLILMAVYHACLRYGQVHLGQIYQWTTDRLIGRMGGASLEQIFRLLVQKAMLDSKLQEMEIGKEVVTALQTQIHRDLDAQLSDQDLAEGVTEGPTGSSEPSGEP